MCAQTARKEKQVPVDVMSRGCVPPQPDLPQINANPAALQLRKFEEYLKTNLHRTNIEK